MGRDEILRERINAIGRESFPEDTDLSWQVVKIVHSGDYSFVVAEPIPAEAFPYGQIMFVMWFPSSSEPVNVAGYSWGVGAWDPFWTVPNTPSDWEAVKPEELFGGFTPLEPAPTAAATKPKKVNEVVANVVAAVFVFFAVVVGLLLLSIWIYGWISPLSRNITVLVRIVVAVIVGAVLETVRRRWRSALRSRMIEAVGGELGLSYANRGDKSLLQGWSDYQLFSLSGSKVIKNVLRGNVHGFEVTVFDYESESHSSDIDGSSSRASTRRHTVAYFCSDGLDFPAFVLRPKNLIWAMVSLTLFLGKLTSRRFTARAFGMSSLEFEGHPRFSKNYQVYVPHKDDDERVRNLFSHHVLAYFEDRHAQGLSVEGSGNRLIVYAGNMLKSKQVKAKDIPAFLESARAIVMLLKQ